VVGTTWWYVNRDGGHDRRFNDNRQLPVVQYDVLNISAPRGLRLRLHLSTSGLAAGTTALMGLVEAAIVDLKSRGAPLTPKTPSPGTEGLDLPPLVEPALKVAQVGKAAIEYRWLAALPEWAVPIVWGLVFALPAVALMIVAARGLSVESGVFMGVALLVSACGIPVLVRDRKQHLRERRAAEEKQRKSRFRAALTSILRSQLASSLDFEALAAANGLSGAEAESVADELYRLMAERVVADGVISPKEKQKLQRLAKALRLTPGRAIRLEAGQPRSAIDRP
jgi:hypothetical protein